ncbi:hypothetical protein AALP_AA3G165400 [Arabis alpina]|uniref:F-box domain-containing protein n=1 Tax=Arabis alpina TaxID=50452 RepID=A0A087H9M2_ARAAL|nr:hypothetical protein AALP_AA3G165400 [Arabis alpina]
MEISVASVTVSVAIVLVSWWVWRTLNWVWFKPKMLESYLRRQGLAGTPYTPLVGDVKRNFNMLRKARSKPIKLTDDITSRVAPYPLQMVKTYGRTFFTWLGPIPTITIMDPEHIKEVLNKIYDFQKPHVFPLGRFIATGLFSHDGDKWAKHRTIINPAFHLEKIKNMVPAFHQTCSEAVSQWDNLVSDKGSSCEVDIWPGLVSLTADVISRTAFGSSYKEGQKIFELQAEVAELLIQALRKVFIPGYRYLPTKGNRRMKAAAAEIQAILRGIINKRLTAREAGEAPSDDLLGILLESNLEQGKGNGMSIEDVMEECKLFYFAGQETTSVLLVWTMILLGHHQDWQARAREEVKQVFGDKEPDTEGLNQLKVMNMIFYEVLRLYPPVIQLTRAIHKEMKLGDMTLPGGVHISLPILLVQHDTKLWGNDAAEFKPERFKDEEKQMSESSDVSQRVCSKAQKIDAGSIDDHSSVRDDIMREVDVGTGLSGALKRLREQGTFKEEKRQDIDSKRSVSVNMSRFPWEATWATESMYPEAKRACLVTIPSSTETQLCSEDRFSGLHESVLSRILSYLPTVEAVRTSVLSKTWRNAWTNVTELWFDDRMRRDPKDCRFTESVERVLSGIGSSHINSFHLHSVNSCDGALPVPWLSNVLSRKLQKLVITWQKPEGYFFSPFFASFGSLVELRLRMTSVFIISAPALLPNLKFLSLSDAIITKEYSSVSKNLFLKFPVMATFEASNCCCFETETIMIDSPLLKIFEMFNCSSDLVPNVSGVSRSCLRSFYIALHASRVWLSRKDLELTEVPIFKHLVYLHLIYDMRRDYIFRSFLKSTPKLEMLSICELPSRPSSESLEELRLKPAPDCVRTILRVLQIRNFDTNKLQQHSVLRYVMEKAEVLGSVILSKPVSMTEKAKAQILSYPKASPNASVFFL